MSEKLAKIAADLKKARAKRDQWDRRVKELERKYRDAENTEIHELVHSVGLTPEQLAALLKTLPGIAPGGSPLDAARSLDAASRSDTTDYSIESKENKEEDPTYEN